MFVNPGTPPKILIQKLLRMIRTSSPNRKVNRRKYAPLNLNVKRPMGRDKIAATTIARGKLTKKGKPSLVTINVEAYAPIPIKAACAKLSSPTIRIAYRLHAKITLMPTRQKICKVYGS